MKPFKDMDNIDKGKLLHELFPDDINHMLTFLEDSANMILNAPSLMPEDWNRKIPLAEWMEQAQILKSKITGHREQMVKDSDCFASTFVQRLSRLFSNTMPERLHAANTKSKISRPDRSIFLSVSYKESCRPAMGGTAALSSFQTNKSDHY